MKDLINKYKNIKPPTFEQRTGILINEMLEIKVREIEQLFDFAIINNLEIDKREYFQGLILNFKCEELEEKENGNNIK